MWHHTCIYVIINQFRQPANGSPMTETNALRIEKITVCGPRLTSDVDIINGIVIEITPEAIPSITFSAKKPRRSTVSFGQHNTEQVSMQVLQAPFMKAIGIQVCGNNINEFVAKVPLKKSPERIPDLFQGLRPLRDFLITHARWS